MQDSKIRVLLADDVAEYRLLVRLLLEQDGRFEIVAEATNGDEAVHLATEQRPDVVLLDLAMPLKDGLQALGEIRARLPETKIVVLSGFAHTELSDEAVSRGAAAYLEKGEAASLIVSTLVEVAA